ncbi:MAG: HDOD domain-containing protein [Planctomycetota bacterium]
MSNSTLAHLAQQERTRREVLHKSDLIPPLPDLVVRVLNLLNRADTDPGQLESHLRYDQVLVAKMLGMVNSPFYGLSRRVSTVRDAIMMLGFRGLRSLLLATSTAKFLARDFRNYGFADRGLWLHSITVAAASRTLTRRLGGSSEMAEQLFVAGLLHDIGKMLLAPYLIERRVTVVSGSSALEVEKRHVGIDHTEAGALVAAKWNLAPSVQEIIKQHHGDVTPSPFTKEVAIVTLANEVARIKRYGLAADFMPPQEPVDPVLQVLGITAENWPEHCDAAVQSMEIALASMASFSS